jgi:6,7-dimethyl-8-ribityllumazine synthase
VSEPYDRAAGGRDVAPEPIEDASENVLDGWPSSEDIPRFSNESGERVAATSAPVVADRAAESDSSEPEADPVAEASSERVADPAPDEPAPAPLVDPDPVVHASSEHAPGELRVPPGYSVLEGEPHGARRAVGIVVSRFNGEVTSRLLESALDELERAGVAADAITVMPVPGAFELPIGAMALAKTRRYACVVALGCVIRGDTPHFDYVAAEAASGLQLAGLETGVPVSFGVLTLERADQAEARIDKGAEAVRTGLEMADLFAHLRAAAAR